MEFYYLSKNLFTKYNSIIEIVVNKNKKLWRILNKITYQDVDANV